MTTDRINPLHKLEHEPPIMSSPGICSPIGPFSKGRLSMREITRFAKGGLILEDAKMDRPRSYPLLPALVKQTKIQPENR